MGSGKSTIGPMVANVLGYAFVDLDERIEAELGCSIADYFERAGEEAFRDVEARLLRATAERAEQVVSLGGGTVVQPGNLDFARRHGVVVYLQWSAEALAERLSYSTDRPLLQDEDGRTLPRPDLEARVRAMLATREPIYRQAHITVPLDGYSVGWSVDRVVDAVRAWARKQRKRA